MNATTTSPDYDQVIRNIEWAVRKLNELIGGGATFGYIGNMERWGDDRCWYVFLPHPGRMGTPADRLGGFRTGDVDGARRAAEAVRGALTILRWQKVN